MSDKIIKLSNKHDLKDLICNSIEKALNPLLAKEAGGASQCGEIRAICLPSMVSFWSLREESPYNSRRSVTENSQTQRFAFQNGNN